MTYIYLTVAIIFEVVGTTALKHSEGFTRLGASLVTVASYALAFYFLSLPIRVFPVGVVYAIWSGFGIVLITLIGWLWFRQSLDLAALIGIAFIIAGVLIVNLFSKALVH